jgi:glycerol kinase
MKATYGTGCFALLNTGDAPAASKRRLLTTIAYQLGGKRSYALEGAIFIAGAAVQWLRDALKVIVAAPDVNALAAAADPAEEVYLVPAFVGLGAPWWDAQARGALFGLTRKSGMPELARATLEAVGYQTRDLLEAMRADWPAVGTDTVLRVDGGMAASDVTMQFVADILAAPVDRPAVMETTALGAAYLAGQAAGLCPDLPGFAATWKRERRFEPVMDAKTRERKWAGWRDAVAKSLFDRMVSILANHVRSCAAATTTVRNRAGTFPIPSASPCSPRRPTARPSTKPAFVQSSRRALVSQPEC